MTRPAIASISVMAAAIVLIATAAFRSWSPLRVDKIPALASDTNPWPGDSFQELGYLAALAEIPPGLQVRGSRVNHRSEFRGEFLSGWFTARPVVGMLVSGFPKSPGNSLALELRNAQGEIRVFSFDPVNPGEDWQPWRVALPAGAVSFRIRAVDGTTDFNGWLAVTDPFVPSGRPAFQTQLARTFQAFAIQAVLFLTLGLPVGRCLAGKPWCPPPLVPLLAGAAVASLGYAAFWIYFAHPLAGRIFTWGTLLVSCGFAISGRRQSEPADRTLRHPLFLAALIALFYLALLLLYEPTRFSYTAANRFEAGLPSDNEIPRAFADRLWRGQSPRELWGDWQSSDRPPLQAGWQLLTWPVLHALGFDLDVSANTAGVCFQLLWVFAVWALVRHLGASARQALGIVAAIAFSGVLLEYSVFVWPKLAAAALVVAAYLLWRDERSGRPQLRFAIGGWCAALGWLAHGGVAFSLLGLAPLVLVWRSRVRSLHWLCALAAFGAVAAPWTAYQKFYDPPGNRLLKWHLGGEMGIDRRGALEAIADGYRKAGLATTLRNKWSNVRFQFEGRWPGLRDFDLSLKSTRLREGETVYTVRSWGAWILALLAPLLWLVRARPAPPAETRRALLELCWWFLGGACVWLALLFMPNTATIHQGTLVTQLLGPALLAVGAFQLNRWYFAALATFQAAWFALAWTPPSPLVEGRLLPAPALLAVICGMVLLALVWLGAWAEKSPGHRT